MNSFTRFATFPYRRIIKPLVLVLVLVYAGWIAFKWTVMRVYVGPGEALLVVNKFGKPLAGDQIVVPVGHNEYQGIREEVLGPGRYFFDPIEYHTDIVHQTEIPAGDPSKWEFDSNGRLKDSSTAPMIGLVSLRGGLTPPPGQVVVDPGYKGVQKDVLTPGVYKINPMQKEVSIVPAVIVPPGSVGVVTRQVGDIGVVSSATLSEIRASTTGPTTQPDAAGLLAPPKADAPSRLVVGDSQRGILKDVLQPGIYYLNPRMVKVNIVPVGYDQITLDQNTKSAIRFYTDDGYQVEADFTVVWGRTPIDAPHIVANIGDIDKVRTNVIEPAMKAACQNEGAKYSAKELIQGLTRSKFQDELTASLEKQVESRNVHILLALIRNISIKDTVGNDATGGLLATIQRANIEIERGLTNQQKTLTAAKKAELEQALRLVDVARQTVTGETSVKVANIQADGAKKAAEMGAQQEVEVASIALEMSKLEAQRTQILGKAKADVDRMKNDADAKGAKMLVDAFGSPQSYNLYIFAKNFEPTDLRMIFAGPGTFWTDLKSFEQVGASKLLQQQPAPAKSAQ